MADATVSAVNVPADLLNAQRELLQVRADLHALLKRLPWSRVPSEAMKSDGWRFFERPATEGWGEQDAADVDRLRARELTLATTIVCHRHFRSVQGPDVARERSRIKHLPEVQPAAAVPSE